jgi:hypothetical protein
MFLFELPYKFSDMRLFYPIFILLFSCSQSGNTVSNNESTINPENETALKGCEICVLTTKLSELEKQEIEFGVRKLNDCETKLFLKVKSEKDSLGKVVKGLLEQYKLDYNSAATKCAELYPMDKISDENLRNSLLFEIEHWNFYARTLHINPVFDTTCGKKDYYEDGKYGLKVKGEIVWVSEEKYASLVNKYYSTKPKIDNLILERKKALAKKLTDIEDPDEYCMEMMNRKSKTVLNKLYEKYNTLHKPIDDTELNELLTLINKID